MVKTESITAKQRALIYGGLTIFGLAIAGPVLAVAATGAFSLVKIVGCVVVLFIGYMFLPVFKMKLKNQVLKSIKAEARENPVESLQNEYIERSEAIKLVKEREVNMITMRDSLAQKLENFQKKHKTSDEGMQKMLDASTHLINKMKVVSARATQELIEFAQLIELESDRYDMAVSTGALAKAISEATGDQDPLRQFVQNEALDSIREKFNRSMAEINQLLEGSEVPKLLSNDRDIDGVIDVTPINTENFVPVSRRN